MDPKQCPWCQRWCLKDDKCNYIFACGLEANGKFIIGAGCGSSWCWQCGKKFCGPYYLSNGQKASTAKEMHDSHCCKKSSEFTQETFCEGGHNSHCEKRW